MRRHRWILLHAAGRVLGLGFLLLPRRSRFSAARVLAHGLAGIVARTPMFREQQRLRIDSAEDVTLYEVLRMMTRAGVEFDLALRVEGVEHVDSAAGSGRGVLLTGAHATLNYLGARWLYERGLDPVVIDADPSAPMLGSRRRSRGIRGSGAFLRSVVRHLRAADWVCAMIDRDQPGKRTVEVPMGNGAILVADALFRLALRTGACVRFIAARAGPDGGVVLVFGRPPAEGEHDLDGLLRSFAAFVRAQSGALNGRG